MTPRLDAVNAKVAASAARVQALDDQRVDRTPALEERLQALYKRGRHGYVRLLLDTADQRDLARASRGVVSLARIEEIRIAEHRRLLAEEQAARAQLESEQRQVTRLRAEAVNLETAATQAVAERSRMLDDLDRRRELAAQFVGELDQARQRLQSTIAGLDGGARDRSAAAAVPGRPAVAAGRAACSRGSAVPPPAPSARPSSATASRSGAATGSPVRAVHGGTVAYAAPFTGYGVMVILDHGQDAFTVYGHLSGTALRPGVAVTRGQLVGHRRRHAGRRAGGLLRGADRRSSGQSRTMAAQGPMTSRTRVAVLLVSLPVLAFAVVGGVLGRTASAQGESYRYLRIFEDVVTLIVDNYVEEVDVDKVMHGAMHGLADGLDPDSAYLDAAQMKTVDAATRRRRASGPRADAAVLPARRRRARRLAGGEGRACGPATTSARSTASRPATSSVFEGMRLLRGKPGTKVKLAILRGNAAEPHDVELVREALPARAGARPRRRLPAPAPAHRGVLADDGRRSAQRGRRVDPRRRHHVVIDLRGTATGDLDAGFDVARLFVPRACSATGRARGQEKAGGQRRRRRRRARPCRWRSSPTTARRAPPKSSPRRSPATSGRRVVGERSQGRAGRQKLVPLPDGAGLLLTHLLYLGPGGAALQETGVTPDVAVDVPVGRFRRRARARRPASRQGDRDAGRAKKAA